MISKNNGRSGAGSRRELCRQRDDWKRAALGMLALSLAGNIALYGAKLKAEERHQSELRYVETVRDNALEELGRTVSAAALEAQARQEQAEAYEAIGAYQYIGECTITAYCPCVECCGRWADGVTASGLPAGPGIVAVDPDVIPLGSMVVVDGQRYLAADTGSGVEGLHIDICMASHEETAAFGRRSAPVWVEEEARP